MKVRIATTNDALEMHRLHTDAVTQTCSEFYTKEQINAWLSGRTPEGYHEAINKGDMFVAEENNSVIGFGHAIPGEIVAVYVNPDSHQKGVGKALLDYGLTIAQKDHSKVIVQSTLNAQPFYEKYGFVKVRDDVYVKKGVESPIVVLEYIV